MYVYILFSLKHCCLRVVEMEAQCGARGEGGRNGGDGVALCFF